MAKSKAEIAEAYSTVAENEKKILTEVQTLANSFKQSLDEIVAMLPEGQSSHVGQYLQRIRASVDGVFGFDLINMKNLYGLNTETPAQ